MKGKGIAGRGRRELRRGHGREYHNWVALVKGKLENFKRRSKANPAGDFCCFFALTLDMTRSLL
jgi:hypothetical protein